MDRQRALQLQPKWRVFPHFDYARARQHLLRHNCGRPLFSGTIFLLAPPSNPGGAWTDTILHAFEHPGANDGEPSPVLLGSNGVLYGTTTGGGGAGDGTVFELTPPSSPGGAWNENILWNFGQVYEDGAAPSGGLLRGINGSFYGTTVSGGLDVGNVFELSPTANGNWSEVVLHVFTEVNDGAYPTAGLIHDQDGNLYGTTEYGAEEAPGCGPRFGCGTVFELSPPSRLNPEWTETVLHGFTGPPDGLSPYAGVVLGPNGVLYGTTQWGGTSTNCAKAGHAGCGTVFQLTPSTSPGGPWTERILHSFSHGEDGAYPTAGLVLGKNGVLYGATIEGGPNNYGTIFEVEP